MIIEKINNYLAIRFLKNKRPELVNVYTDYQGQEFMLDMKGIYLGLIEK